MMSNIMVRCNAQDFVGTIAPFVRVAMALRTAVPVPPRLRVDVVGANATTTLAGAEVVAMKTAWGGWSYQNPSAISVSVSSKLNIYQATLRTVVRNRCVNCFLRG